MAAARSGWALYEASTALTRTLISSPGLSFDASISKSSISQNVHAQALESGWSEPSLSVAVCQDKPLFAETSTLIIALPPPDQAKPLAEV